MTCVCRRTSDSRLMQTLSGVQGENGSSTSNLNGGNLFKLQWWRRLHEDANKDVAGLWRTVETESTYGEVQSDVMLW